MAKRRTTSRQRAASRRNLAKARAARSRKRSTRVEEYRLAAVLVGALFVIGVVIATRGLALVAVVLVIALVMFVRSRRKREQAMQYQAWRAFQIEQARQVDALRALSPAQFESTVAILLSSSGYIDVKVVGSSGDLTADIAGFDPAGLPFIAQCKRYAEGNRVGTKDLQQFIGMGYVHHRASRLIYFTTSDYTKPAVALAQRHQITLMTGRDVARLAESVALVDMEEPEVLRPPPILDGLDDLTVAYSTPELVPAPASPPTTQSDWDQAHWQLCTVCRSTKTRWRGPEGQALCPRCRDGGFTGSSEEQA